MKRFLISAISSVAIAVALAACGSNVKLSDVPVEDRSTGATVPGADSSASSRGVAPVQIGATDNAAGGPTNVAKIIYFDFDSFAIKPESQSAVDAHAKFLSANKSRKVSIEGHTDERGGREYNLALGQKRSEAVRRALNLLGVGDAQVEAVSFGKEKPAATGGSDDAMAQNRRAELNYR